jgi:hypothetical protein
MAVYKFHHEVRTSVGGFTCIEYLCDIRVVHHRQRLLLSCEPSHHFIAQHPEPHNFQRDAASHRLCLFSFVNTAHATFAQQPHEPVRANRLRLISDRPQDVWA